MLGWLILIVPIVLFCLSILTLYIGGVNPRNHNEINDKKVFDWFREWLFYHDEIFVVILIVTGVTILIVTPVTLIVRADQHVYVEQVETTRKMVEARNTNQFTEIERAALLNTVIKMNEEIISSKYWCKKMDPFFIDEINDMQLLE